MKKIILTLLAITLILSVLAACVKNYNDYNKSDTTTSSQNSIVSSEIDQSELEDWWGNNASIEVETNSNVSSDKQNSSSTNSSTTSSTTSSATSSTASTGGTSSATSSYDKDQGFGDWVPAY